MKARNIHRIAHWVIMTLLLTFPILMVGISTFGNESQTIDVTETYEYETNEVNSVDDLVVGNIYKYTLNAIPAQSTVLLATNYFYYADDDIKVVNAKDYYAITYESDLTRIVAYWYNGTTITYSKNSMNLYLSEIEMPMIFYFVYQFTNSLNVANVSASDYLGEKNVDYVIHNEDYKQDVNNWINGFLNLPINAWYQSLMNVIGVGFTNSTVMNVIYVMPIYIIWVFIFDLVVDCFLVLIRLPHKLLNRLSGGENE